jgi:large subunit ribosomal protein L21
MLYAIVENGGKQYKAVEGGYIEVDLLSDQVGKKKTFENVLLLVNGDDVNIGSPYLQGVSVDTTVVEHFKAPKVTVFKYRPKQRYRVKSGHRQKYTKVIVNSIAFSGKSEAVVEKKAEEAPAEKSKQKARSKPSGKKKEGKTKAAPKKSEKEAPSTRKSVDFLDLGTRTTNSLKDAGINTVGQLLKKLESGDEAMLDVSGIGDKSLTDIKKKLKKFGYK